MELTSPVIAHRGASAYAPENTLAAFNKALSLGACCLEFDVMCSADGEVFVIHDNNLKRTTNGRGKVEVAQSTYMETLDAGRWFSKQFTGEKVPHFRDALNFLSFAGLQANIEIKPTPGSTEQTTTAVLRLINRHWPQDKPLPLISSFDWDVLALCQSIAPEMPLGLLMDVWRDDCVIQAEKYGCLSVHVNRKLLTEGRVKLIKDAGFKLYVYTVNRKKQALKLLGWGVDAVFSDYPDLLGD